jgi:hypothetical protein
VVLNAVKGLAMPETGQAYARARQLWEQLGSPAEFLQIPFGQSRYHVFRGELDLAQRLDEDLLRLSRQRNDSAGLVLGHLSSGRTHLLRLSRQRNDSAGLVLGHLSSGRTLRFAGRFASCRSHFERGACAL